MQESVKCTYLDGQSVPQPLPQFPLNQSFNPFLTLRIDTIRSPPTLPFLITPESMNVEMLSNSDSASE